MILPLSLIFLHIEKNFKTSIKLLRLFTFYQAPKSYQLLFYISLDVYIHNVVIQLGTLLSSEHVYIVRSRHVTYHTQYILSEHKHLHSNEKFYGVVSILSELYIKSSYFVLIRKRLMSPFSFYICSAIFDFIASPWIVTFLFSSSVIFCIK